ncbi:hypothetical protein V6N13_058949 [Hibiscus sabdariffa]|uniref:Uncharacterized protein n=2 Tax=Hibiscus sabdariffa TaxID=183260 RepID=A0ABR2GFN5_9ROSI
MALSKVTTEILEVIRTDSRLDNEFSCLRDRIANREITTLPLPMDATTSDLDDQVLNLEDKVLKKGDGNVVDAAVAQHNKYNEIDKQQPSRTTHEVETVTKGQDVRRGSRKKLPPCTLTDYVHY